MSLKSGSYPQPIPAFPFLSFPLSTPFIFHHNLHPPSASEETGSPQGLGSLSPMCYFTAGPNRLESTAKPGYLQLFLLYRLLWAQSSAASVIPRTQGECQPHTQPGEKHTELYSICNGHYGNQYPEGHPAVWFPVWVHSLLFFYC